MKGLLDRIKKSSGTGVYAALIQFASLLPLVYLLVGAGASVIYTHRGFFSVLFELGLSFLSRAEVYCASLFYRRFGNEIYLVFAILIIALIFGLVIKRLRAGSQKTQKVTAAVLAIWCICDIILRLLPLRINTVQEPVFRILGLIFRIICLCLVAGRFLKKEK